MGESRIKVEVIFADRDSQVRRRLQVARGSTVAQAITASGIGSMLPEGAVELARVAIFGHRVAAEQVVRDGDRIEICRPLSLDPMEARRRRSR